MLYFVPFVLVCIAVIADLKTRTIPDWISMIIVGWAIMAKALHYSPLSWASIGLGLLIGFGVGYALFALEGFGGGDVKLVTVLGALLGWQNELHLVMWVGLFGGGLAIIAKLRKQSEFAYAPAIGFGLSVVLFNYAR